MTSNERRKVLTLCMVSIRLRRERSPPRDGTREHGSVTEDGSSVLDIPSLPILANTKALCREVTHGQKNGPIVPYMTTFEGRGRGQGQRVRYSRSNEAIVAISI